jgi:hypothetical protein
VLANLNRPADNYRICVIIFRNAISLQHINIFVELEDPYTLLVLTGLNEICEILNDLNKIWATG